MAALLVELVMEGVLDEWSLLKIATLYLMPWAISLDQQPPGKTRDFYSELVSGLDRYRTSLFTKSLTLKSEFYHF